MFFSVIEHEFARSHSFILVNGLFLVYLHQVFYKLRLIGIFIEQLIQTDVVFILIKDLGYQYFVLSVRFFVFSLKILWAVSVAASFCSDNAWVRTYFFQFETGHFVAAGGVRFVKSVLIRCYSFPWCVPNRLIFLCELSASWILALYRVELLTLRRILGEQVLGLVCSCTRLTFETCLAVVLDGGVLLGSFPLKWRHTFTPGVVQIWVVVGTACVSELVQRLCLWRSHRRATLNNIWNGSILALANPSIGDVAIVFGSLALRVYVLELANRWMSLLISRKALDFLYDRAWWSGHSDVWDRSIGEWVVLVDRRVLLDDIHVFLDSLRVARCVSILLAA